MHVYDRTLVVSVPHPRSLELIFTAEQKRNLFDRYDIVECAPEGLSELPEATLRRVKYVIGQPAISPELLARLTTLKCILNVESNLINNMPYETLFERGIHVVTTGAVFAEPVAELAIGLALDLARGIGEANRQFEDGKELWGGDGNGGARLLSGSDVGIWRSWQGAQSGALRFQSQGERL
jgi:phosphoglycerate dehydrogenase-like enzyme